MRRGPDISLRRIYLIDPFKKFYTIAERVTKLESPKIRYLNAFDYLYAMTFQFAAPRIQRFDSISDVGLGCRPVGIVLGPDMNLKSVELEPKSAAAF